MYNPGNQNSPPMEKETHLSELSLPAKNNKGSKKQIGIKKRDKGIKQHFLFDAYPKNLWKGSLLGSVATHDL